MSSGSRRMSPSSWTATAGGRRSGTCRASKAIAAGIESVRDTVETAARLGIEVLTLYAFSMENWKRPRAEVDTLMLLLKRYIRLELETLNRNNIRFRVIGRTEALSPDVQDELALGIEQNGVQHRPALQHRAQLRRPRRDRGRRTPRHGVGLVAGGPRRAAVRRLSLHGRPAGSGSADSHERRAACEQFPAVADCVRRNLGHRNALAGFPAPRPVRGHRRVSEARPPVRRADPVARCPFLEVTRV